MELVAQYCKRYVIFYGSQMGWGFIESASLCNRWAATGYTLVHLSCVSQITMTWVRLRRRTPTVHLAGSFIVIQRLAALSHTRRQRSDSVLTLVSTTSAVLLFSGLDVIRAARYITWDLVHVCTILTSHSLTSSDDVTVHQVHDRFSRLHIILYCKFCKWFFTARLIRIARYVVCASVCPSVYPSKVRLRVLARRLNVSLLNQRLLGPNSTRSLSFCWNSNAIISIGAKYTRIRTRRGLRSSPPACTVSLTVGGSKAPWSWPWPWIGSRTRQHTQYV